MSRRAKPLLQDDSVAKSKPARPRDPAQPNLPCDPMPERIEPCLALLKPVPPKGPDWVFEVKWDGYRLAIHIEPTGVRIITRGGHDWTHRFPAIAEATSQLGVGTAILDGEAVVLDEEDGPISGRCSARSADAVASVRRRSRCFSLSTCSISMATACQAPNSPCAGVCLSAFSTAPLARSSRPRKCSGMAHFSRRLAPWASRGSSPSIGIGPIAPAAPATG